MVSPLQLIGERKIEICNLVATARLEDALKLLIDLVKNVAEDQQKTAILLSMEYYDLKEEYLGNLIARDDFRISKNRIAKRMLDYIDLLNDRVALAQA